MRIHRALLIWQLGRTVPVTLLMLPVALLYVLFSSDRLQFRIETWPGLVVPLHCLLIAWSLGRTTSPSFRFLYTQGYSRDSLWGHTILASTIAVLAVWVPIGLLIFLPVRATVQDVFQNPFFPFAAWTERAWVWSWLLVYVCLLPPFHYAWIRSGLARRGVMTGYLLGMAAFGVGMILWLNLARSWYSISFSVGTAALLVAAGAMLVGGRSVHRRIEVLG